MSYSELPHFSIPARLRKRTFVALYLSLARVADVKLHSVFDYTDRL